MPKSAVPFLSKRIIGYFPATPASVVSGTATAETAASGSYGMTLGNSATVKMQFPIPTMGQCPAELLPPYELYNLPVSIGVEQSFLTVYYSVATDPLTSATIALYATYYSPTGAVVTTLLAATALALTVGTHSVQIPLSSLPAVPVPNSIVVAELDIATAAGGTAIVNGISVN